MTSKRKPAVATAGSKRPRRNGRRRRRSSSRTSNSSTAADHKAPRATEQGTSARASPPHETAHDDSNHADNLNTVLAPQQNVSAATYERTASIITTTTLAEHRSSHAVSEPSSRASTSSFPSFFTTDDEDVEALQRFSNTSLHPHHSHAKHGDHNDSPPQLSTTPPPSSLSRTAAEMENAEDGKRKSASCLVTDTGFLMRVSPPATVDHASVSPASTLLAELLMAEAERASATAATDAAAPEAVHPLYTKSSPPLSALQEPTLRPPPFVASGGAASRQHSNRRISSSEGRPDGLAPLAVHIGVVPLPGRAPPHAAPSGDARFLPWVRALHTSATTATTTTAAAKASLTASTTTAAEIERANVRCLRPRRLLVRSHTLTADQEQPHSGSRGSNTSTSSLPTTAITSDMVGWFADFAEVPLVLPGAQPPRTSESSEKKTARCAYDARKDGDLPAGAQVCLGAATVTLMIT